MECREEDARANESLWIQMNGTLYDKRTNPCGCNLMHGSTAGESSADGQLVVIDQEPADFCTDMHEQCRGVVALSDDAIERAKHDFDSVCVDPPGIDLNGLKKIFIALHPDKEGGMTEAQVKTRKEARDALYGIQAGVGHD